MKKLATFGLVLGLVASAANANILVNGDFEDGDVGQLGTPMPGWNSWGGNGWHHNDAGATLDAKAMLLWWTDSGLWQDFAVVAGQDYDFSAQAMNPSDRLLTNLNLLIKAEFYDSSVGTDPGQALAEIEVDRFFSDSDPADQWVEIGGTVTAPENADVGRIVFLLVDHVDPSGGVINFDNAVVTPEPASLALLCLGGVALLRRRR